MILTGKTMGHTLPLYIDSRKDVSKELILVYDLYLKRQTSNSAGHTAEYMTFDCMYSPFNWPITELVLPRDTCIITCM